MNNLSLMESCQQVVMINLRWLKTVSSTFQAVDFDGPVITTFYQLMLQSWYQITAKSPVNTLVFSWHNRLP